MKKKYAYVLVILIVAILGYKSVYFKKLDEVKNAQKENFNFKAYADSIYYKGILKNNNTISFNDLIASMKSNSEKAFKEHGNRLGIGNSAFFMIHSTGKIAAIFLHRS